MDGQGFASLWALLCGEKDGSRLPAFPAKPWYYWMVVNAAMIFLAPLQGLIYLCRRVDRNIMSRGLPVSPKKRGAFTREIEIAKVKALAKKFDATVNDCVMAIISNGFYRYFSRNGTKYGEMRDGPIPK